MRISIILPIVVLLLFCFSCETRTEEKIDFIEIRITRWTALEGGETFVLRKINKDWSAILLGDGSRFSCLYHKSVKPKSDWNNFLLSLQAEGLLEIPDGIHTNNCCLDGSGFIVEVLYDDKLKRYSFENPKVLKTKESKQILRIGDIINREFNTPVFVADYDRGEVGKYFIDTCNAFKKTSN